MSKSFSDATLVNTDTSPTMSRRDFGKVFAGLGLATIAPGMTEAAEAEDKAQKLREGFAIKGNASPIMIDEKVFKRYDSTKYAFLTYTDKHGAPFFVHMGKKEYENMLAGKTHKDIDVGSIAAARSVFALNQGATTVESRSSFTENKGNQSWNSINVGDNWYKRKPDEIDPSILTVQTKLAARLFGADLVGFSTLNRNWVYSYAAKNRFRKEADLNTKAIVFKDVEYPDENDTELIIPNSVNNAIVMCLSSAREIVQTAPSVMSMASSSLGYSRQMMLSDSLCEYIRTMGYVAIPCSNATTKNVAMGIEAGLGQAGRLGTLITPEFGPNVKVISVLTNMPMHHDKPIDFGVTEFCDTCKKCARECPSKSITEGPRSFKARTTCSNDGVYQWQNDYMKCIEYWAEGGSNCSICLAVCPYTKGAAWVHDLVGFTIDKMRFMDPVMLGLDDAFGYGERRKEEDIWNMTTSTYGINLKHARKNIHKGKFPL